MARAIRPGEMDFGDLEAPPLDLASADEPEVMLRRLRLQNSALDRLRYALAAEDNPLSSGCSSHQ